MTRANLLQIAVFAALFGLLELGTQMGWISRFTIIPPSEMVTGAYNLFASGKIVPDFVSTMWSVIVASLLAIATGFVAGAMVHSLPQLRRTLDPFFASYYAVPIFAFYPLFIFIFGLTDIPKMIIAYFYAVVAMMINTMNGLDRMPAVYSKTARVLRMSGTAKTFWVTLPAAMPYVFTGVKLAIAYAFLGTIAAEFILSTSGLGHAISFAYLNFDNNGLYSNILIVLTLSVVLNMVLFYWERILLTRRGLA
ncbi:MULTISPECIES: ABC transporter permease [Allomesorhizobium]|uniref:ABC transporter n=2 Tax=Allomesorhizobium TaxID=3143699 RepID=H0HWX1_9HYPH|nr:MULTISPECIES: ABC transporter permease subunit [Mesorhizobium]EHK54774.1 ABC transporter [Mesorhizobium alhagi CCNWXJ12-2]NGO53749.1 ABC transporter permease subunit [Mesorhizobium camelthorni]